MDLMNIAELKSHLSEVMNKVSQTGDTVVIGKYGKPIAKIVPFTESEKDRKVGFAEHLVTTDQASLQQQVSAPSDCETLDGFYQ